MKTISRIEFPKYEDWLDGPLPVSPTCPSGWTGLEKIMPSLVRLFCRGHASALEFGVEYGYSTSVLAQLFNHVNGVDWFKGDEHSGHRESYYETAKANLANRKNVTLNVSSYQEWIARGNHRYYDLVHVDVVHTYEATYTVGKFAASYSPVVIFHDTQYIWPEVKEAILRIAVETGKEFYNYEDCNGLGILF